MKRPTPIPSFFSFFVCARTCETSELKKKKNLIYILFLFVFRGRPTLISSIKKCPSKIQSKQWALGKLNKVSYGIRFCILCWPNAIIAFSCGFFLHSLFIICRFKNINEFNAHFVAIKQSVHFESSHFAFALFLSFVFCAVFFNINIVIVHARHSLDVTIE